MATVSYIRNTTECRDLVYRGNRTVTSTQGLEGSISNMEMFWLFVGFGVFTGFLAAGFSAIRKYIHHDKNVFDTAFDAGGRVSTGLTATTIISQWTWAATLLQSATVASKYGISGPFWYAAGATIQILLFSIISAQLKIRAPGAKTFLQVIRARFDKKTHVTFCIFGLLTNIIVTAMLMLVLDANSCMLCGRARGRLAMPRDKCKCVSMTHCTGCEKDDKQIRLCKRTIKPQYSCKTHGIFREYVDYLLRIKNWCLMWTILCIIPLTVLLNILELSLGWLYLFMGILIGSAVIPIVLCMFWERLTGVGMIAGSITGTSLALVAWLVTASFEEHGLTNFMDNTGKELPMLIGNLTSICLGGLVCVVVSIIQTKHRGGFLSSETWELTRDIDSPLSPWTEMYATELGLKDAESLDCRPDIEHVKKTFHTSTTIALAGGIGISVFLVIIWPVIMVGVGTLEKMGFFVWVTFGQVWAYLAAIFIIIVPLITEGLDIVKVYKANTKVHSEISNRSKRRSVSKSFVDLKKEDLVKNGHTKNQTDLPEDVEPNNALVTSIQDNYQPMSPVPS